MKPSIPCRGLSFMAATVMVAIASAGAQTQKPNIPILWGDDIGISNISACSGGAGTSRIDSEIPIAGDHDG